MKQLSFFLILCWCTFSTAYSQTAEVSALLKALENQPQDSLRVDLLLQLGEQLLLTQAGDAQNYAEDALKLAEELNHRDGIGKAQLLEGKAHLRQDQLARAENHLERALPWAEQHGDVASRIDLYRHLSEVYQKRNKSRQMQIYRQKHIALQEQLANHANQEKIATLEDQFSAQKDSVSLARLRAIQAQSVADSALGVISQQEAVMLRQSLDLANLEREAAQIEQEKLETQLALEREQQRLAKQRQQLYAIIAGVVILLLLIAGGWLIYQNKQARKMAQRERLEAERLRLLTAGIAHEIKNPLNFVNNFAEGSSEISEELEEALEESKNELTAAQFSLLKELAEELKQNSIDIKKNGLRVNEIVRSMIEYADGSKGKRQPTKLNELLEETVQRAYHGYRAQHPDFNLRIEENYDTSLKSVEMVSQDIGRVFLNLFNNACDALQQKQRETPNFSPVLRVTTAAQNGQAVVRIRDNGTGIPPEVRDKIFTPFFTTKPTGTGNTGLGLSISYEIVVKDHDGKLDVQSEPGKFTEFIIALPFKTVHR